MCTNLCKLNPNIKRSKYPLITPAEAVLLIQDSSKYMMTCCDATKGYWQVPLSPDCQLLMVFDTVGPVQIYPCSNRSDHNCG